jgi:hypothetical protein
MEAWPKPVNTKPLEGIKPQNQAKENGNGRQELPYRFVKAVGAGARTTPASESNTERRYLEEARKSYELKAPIQREGLAEEMLERINDTEVTVRLGDLFGMSKDLREGEKLRLTKIRQPVKEQAKDRELALPTEALEVEHQAVADQVALDSQLMINAVEMGDLPEVQGVFVTTVGLEGVPAGSVIAQDPYLQYLEGLSDGESPQQIYVARDSVPLRVTFPYVNSQGPIECVLDSSSQIVLISLEQARVCGLVWDPTINIFMQSANGQLEKSMGLARNVGFRWGDLKIYLQVHIIRNPAYKILLGRPFDVLTRSRTDHGDGNQLLTLTDPNTGKAWTVPTYDRTKDVGEKKLPTEQSSNKQDVQTRDFR